VAAELAHRTDATTRPSTRMRHRRYRALRPAQSTDATARPDVSEHRTALRPLASPDHARNSPRTSLSGRSDLEKAPNCLILFERM
jgi:hypothetical protein